MLFLKDQIFVYLLTSWLSHVLKIQAPCLGSVFISSVFILYYHRNFKLSFSLFFFPADHFPPWSLPVLKECLSICILSVCVCDTCFIFYVHLMIVFILVWFSMIEIVSAYKSEAQRSIWFIRIYVRED